MDKKRIFSSLSLSSLVVLGVFLVRGSVTSALGGRSFAGENLCNFFLSFQRKPALPPPPPTPTSAGNCEATENSVGTDRALARRSLAATEQQQFAKISIAHSGDHARRNALFVHEICPIERK